MNHGQYMLKEKVKKVLKFIGKTLLWLFIIGLILWGIIVYLWVSNNNKTFAEREFNSDYWHNPKQEFYDPKYGKVINDWCLRGSMYDDLAKNHLSKLKTMNKVIELLGKPDHGRKYWGLFRDKKCFRYDMGACNISSHPILLICFDENKKVTDYFRSTPFGMGTSITKEEVLND